MTAQDEMRLLPWSGTGDKPCYLSSDDPDGYLARLADSIEAIQLGMAAILLEEVSEALHNQDTTLDEMRSLAEELTGALRDILRVATSRSHLLATNEPRESAC